MVDFYSSPPFNGGHIAIPINEVRITPIAEQILIDAGVDPSDLVRRHAFGDWGDTLPDQWQMNIDGLKRKDCIESIYKVGRGEIWVITDPGWKVTTICTFIER